MVANREDASIEQSIDSRELSSAVLRRLMSGEYPESVLLDLKRQGATDVELAPVFASAAVRQRRKGLLRIVVGVSVSLLTLLIVVAARDAGIEIYGSGLAIGLVILSSGLLKLKNSGEIARAIRSH
jgi:hypothetical protein